MEGGTTSVRHWRVQRMPLNEQDWLDRASINETNACAVRRRTVRLDPGVSIWRYGAKIRPSAILKRQTEKMKRRPRAPKLPTRVCANVLLAIGCHFLRKPRRAIPYFRYTRFHSSILPLFHPSILPSFILIALTALFPLRMRTIIRVFACAVLQQNELSRTVFCCRGWG